MKLLGDVSPTNHNAQRWKAHDVATLFEDTLELFRNNDLNFINLECALPTSGSVTRLASPIS